MENFDKRAYITEKEGQTHYSLGRTHFREWAKRCGAVVHIGKSVRYKKQILDDDLEAQIRAAKE